MPGDAQSRDGRSSAGENVSDEGGSTIWCVECEDVAASVRCEACGGDYMCGLCFQWQHRSGRRAQHAPTPLPGKEMFRESAQGTTQHFITLLQNEDEARTLPQAWEKEEAANHKDDAGEHSNQDQLSGAFLHSKLQASAQFIPLRVSDEERALLRLLEGALEVSEYTDKVDVERGWGWRNSRHDSIREQLSDLVQLMLGLQVAGNYKQGVQLVAGADTKANTAFLQKVLEIGRRNKITNPEKMRCSYGKLMYILQDAPSAIDLSLKTEIKSVHSFLEARGGLALLDDPETVIAIQAVSNAVGVGEDPRSRTWVESMREGKQAAIKRVCARFSTTTLSEPDIEYCLASLSDFNAFINSNRRPVDDMLALLKKHFDPASPQDNLSLQICQGRAGSKLSHSHATQFTFVLQTLMLWQKVTEHMFRLWLLADRDLLNEDNDYRLANTGQGLARVQAAPKIAQAMHSILSRVQQHAGSWVGLSVVHLGDRDVPNALVFIDKYTQIARILKPIVDVVAALPQLQRQQATAHIIEKHGGAAHLQKHILCDFFKHGFDGSGSDGGSCIDGRLTSAWNWCSKLEKKGYYPIFLLAGFQGFDGDFR